MSLLHNVSAGHVLGRYQLLLPIAAGGMAMVWAARLQGTRGFQKTVALKMMLPALNAEPQFEEMFLNEATIASRIRHDNVVHILDLGEDSGLLYLVMEWIDGEPLSALLNLATKKRVPIPTPIAVHLAMQMCAGLHAAHELRDDAGELYGVVHRDVSPQNVLITYEGTAKIVDFGIARITREESHTQTGTVKGKAPYMAPEQVEGGSIDRRTDVFTVGILLYRMTTGRHPFRGENTAESLAKLRSEVPFVSPRSLVAGYPKQLEAVVMQALARDPDARFGTAKELLQALDQALPPSMRITTGEVVAAFMRSLFRDAQQVRRQELMKAVRDVDEAGAATLRIGGAEGPTAFTPSHLLTEFQRFRSERDETSGSTSHVQPVAEVGALPVVQVPRRRASVVWAAALSGLGVAGGVALALVLSHMQGSRGASTAPSATPTVELPDASPQATAPEPVASSAPAPTVAPALPATGVSALSAHLPSAPPPTPPPPVAVGRSPARSRANAPPPVEASPTSTTTPGVASPIQNPGF